MRRFVRQRRLLETLLAHLQRRTAAVDRDLRREEAPPERDFEEQALQVENDEVLEGLLDLGTSQIPLVEQALARLQAGTYGTCEDCGAAIPRERLEAVPYAPTCLSCARAREAVQS